MPKVSVVTPTYNHADYARDCVESVLAQSYSDWEMIVVDDGSDDGTPDLFDSYQDDRIRVVRQRHAGIGALGENYNLALSLAHGDYIAILEGDDVWPTGKLALQVPELDGSDAVLVSGRTMMVDERGRPEHLIPEIVPDGSGLHNEPVGSAAADLLHPSHLTFTFPVATVVRRTTLEAIGGFQSRPYLPVVDLPTFVALASEGPFRWVEDVCGLWRRHVGSTTSGNLPAILDGAFRFAGEWLVEQAPKSTVDPSKLDQLKDAWSAFMVHRAVMLALELKAQGHRSGALKAARLATAFGGPVKRRLKAIAAIVCVGLGAPEAVSRRMTHTVADSSKLNQYEGLVDPGMIDRVVPWGR